MKGNKLLKSPFMYSHQLYLIVHQRNLQKSKKRLDQVTNQLKRRSQNSTNLLTNQFITSLHLILMISKIRVLSVLRRSQMKKSTSLEISNIKVMFLKLRTKLIPLCMKFIKNLSMNKLFLSHINKKLIHTTMKNNLKCIKKKRKKRRLGMLLLILAITQQTKVSSLLTKRKKNKLSRQAV